MSNQKTAPAVVELACIQCGAPYQALLADLDRENARRGKKGLPPLSYGKYVQLFGR